MKLHLPSSLRKALLAVLASTTYFSTADAACLHAAVSPTTYTDFGQNMARYSVYQVNELLTQIRANNGVQIPYTTDTPPATMGVGQPMISFEGVNGDGAFTAVGYNYTATVAHNGCPNPCFTARYVGNDHGIQYQGVEYRSSQDKVFLLSPSIDYKITRSSKIYTDITASGVFDTTEYLRSGRQVTDLVHYRAGAGTCDQADFEGHTHNLAGGYAYITGGVVATLGFSYQGTSESYPIAYDYTKDYAPNEGPRDSRGVIDDPYTISIRGIQDYGPGGAGQPSEDNPKVYLLPFVSRGGDSGSPVWAWNEKTKAYELISCHQARGGDNSYSRGASEWTMAAMEYFNEHVDMDKAGHTVHLHGVVNVPGKSVEKYDETNKVGTTLQYGSITSDAAQDFATVYFCGVGEKGGKTIYTWLSLYDQRDVQNWYHYSNAYFNANGNGSGKDMHLGDLFYTENIVFESDGSADNNIVLDADIDTGIGYVQFSRKAGAPEDESVKFFLQSKEKVDGRDYFLSSAGYIVDEGAELHIQVTNTQKGADGNAYFREWRKQGAGDMFLEGQGDNEIFLNLGGKGTTHLHEDGGYAAYNVLINNGATVNFNGDITQIARDVTFGNGGGFLEFSGLSEFTWESGENTHVEADGFTINALTQDAKLINSAAGTTTTLRYVTPGNTTFLGSFQDTANSNLNVIYAGGGTWTLNSIHTKLHAGSKFTVADGTVELVGQLTVHGIGSIGGKGGTRYSHPDDWHYADSAMNVEVQSGATFRLGSHARLTGNVDVLDGGTLEIAEGVKHRYEYIEGWLIAEDTYQDFYRNFYGLKGDVTLNGNSTLRFNFSSGTDAENVYGRNISGTGNVDMRLGGSGATLVLSGTNNFTGTKHLAGGGLVAEAYTALGNTADNKWHVNKDAFIAVKGIDGNAALEHIDGDSTGVLALTQDQAQQVNLNGTHHENMFVGALAGQVVQYGEAPKTMGSRTVYTETALDTVILNGNKYWQLGGGGGELVVNFLLDDPDSQLVLGNEYTTGTVTLTNAWNRIGSIFFAGKVTLNYTSEEALGGSKISLDYTNRVAGSASVVSSLTRHSSGAMMMDGMEDISVDLTDHKELFLGSEGYVDYTGTITPDGGAYRFGGITGTLVLNNALVNQADEHTNLIVDAQTYSGGTLALAASAGITGDVTVMGHDATRSGFSGGDIALRTDVADAIESAHSVTLKEGGILDINGTEQTLHRFNMEAGSLLTDTSANWNGKVTLEVAEGDTSTLAGAVDVNYMVKEGEGTLLLAGDNAYGNLVINNGLVQLQNGNSLSASGVTIVEDNGVLDFSGGFDVTGTVAFSGGTAKVGAKAINGSLMVGTTGEGEAETGTLLQGTAGISTRINASVEVAEGSTLTMKGENGTFVLSNTEINEAGGNIKLQGHYLTIDRGGSDPVNVGGTIQLEGYGLSGNNRATLYSKGGADNMTRNINALDIHGNATISEESWNTIWNIHALTGEGDLLWDSHTTHWYSAQLVLDGASTFSGQLTAKRTGGAEKNREYQAYLVIAHDQAAQFVDVNATGHTASNFMSVGIDTEYAEMKSLSSDNQYVVLYAGAAQPGTEHDAGTTLHEQPLSTRQAFLTLTGDGDHDFQGNVVGQDVYEQMKTKEDGTQEKIGEVHNTGLSLVMKGSGTQTFSGEQTRFNSVDVNSGHLVLSSANLTIKEDVSLAAGASLEATHGLTLTGGQTLNIYSEGAVSTGNKASFTGNLTLEAGSFVNVGAFTELDGDLVMNDAYMVVTGLAMDPTTPTIGITGSVSGSVEFSLTNTAALSSGTAYYLAGSDWTGTTVNVDLSESPYLTASVNKTNHGLYVTFQTTADSFVWNGNQGSHTWDASHFGQQETVPGASHTAVFTNSAENPDVVISASASVGSIVIDSTRDYLFHSENGSVITTDKLVKSGSGKAEVSAAVVVGTSDKMGTVEINDGELVVKSADTLAHIQSITGAGTLGISYQNAQESVFFHTNDDYVGTLHIENGSYTSDVGLHYNDLLLGNSSTYTLGTNKTIFGAVTVDGNGAEINLQNNTLSAGDIILKSDLTLRGRNLNKATGKLSATVDGVGHTVFTEGEVVISSPNFNANLNVSDNTHLAGGVYSEIGTITLNSSAVLTIDSGTAITNLVDISMGEGSRLNLENGNGGNTSLIANITMAGQTAEIDGSIYGNGTNVQGYITGQGVLTLGIYSGHQNAWRLDSKISDAEGSHLALAINSNVTLTAANTYTGNTTISGSTVQVSNEQAFAGGALNMTGGTLKLNSNLNLTQLTGTGGTLQLNGKRLTLTGNDSGAVDSFAGTVSGTGSLVKTGSANQEFTQAVALTDLAVNGGTLQLGGGSASGTVSVAKDAWFEIKNNDFTISSAVENAGTFAFSGTAHKLVLDPSGAFEQESRGYMDIFGDTVSGNGFAQGTAIKVFNNREGAEVKNIATVEYLGDTLQLDAVTGIATMGASSSVYSVRKGTVTYDSAFTAHPEAADIQTFSLVSESSSAPATLQLNQGLANGVTILSAGLGGNVGIGEGVTLNQSQLDAQVRTTLTGTGTYALAQGAWKLPSNVVLGDKNSWTGVVRVSNFADNGVNFANLANANSWVEVYGMRSGYLAPWQGGNLSTNLILTDNPDVGYAMFMNNGSGKAERPVMTVSGKWKGTGTVRNGNTGQTLNLDLKFTGDISGWQGRYEQTGSSSILYFAAKDDMEVNASFANTGSGYYNMVVDTNTTFNGTIEDAQMFTVKSGATVTLAGADKVMDAITIETSATLVNQGNTTLTGTVANGGTINNLSGANLELSDSATSVGCITNAGTLTLGAKLIEGNITNNGDIIISSLLWEQASGYEDARGNKTESGNGFATNSLSVYDSGVTIEGEGHIYYGGNDVTQEVMSTGAIQSAINHGTYYIKTTDDAVTYSSIVNASANHLEYIQFKTNDGASLRVDSSDGLPHLRTSQVVVNDLYTGTATLSMEDGSTLVVDSSCLARVAATANSSITLQLDATTPDTHMWLRGGFTPNGATVNVTGSGVLDLGAATYDIATLNINGGTVYSEHNGSTGFSGGGKTVNINGGGTLQLNNSDALGWGGSATSKIVMLGDSQADAVLELGNRQTFKTTIEMQGRAAVRQLVGSKFNGAIDAFGGSVSVSGMDNTLAVPIRMRSAMTITVADQGELVFDGGVREQNGTYNSTLTKAGNGKMTLVGNGHQYTNSAFALNGGALDIRTNAEFCNLTSAGALAISSGATGISSYTGNANSTIAVDSGAALAINGNSKLASAITNNGTVAFGSGITLTLNGNFESKGEVYRDIASGTITEGGNGLKSGGYVTVLSGDGNVELNGDVTVKYSSRDYTLQTDGRAYLDSDSSIYYVRTGTTVYNSAVAAESSITRIDLSSGAELDLQANLSAAVQGGAGIRAAGGTVKIGEGIVLSRDSLTASGATTLTGSGVYALDLAKGTDRGNNVSFGNAWNGTVRLGGTAGSQVDLDSIASRGNGSYATLEMAGATASLATGEINAPIVLTNPQEGGAALTVTNSGNFTFKGAISGSGDMVNTASSTYTFSGANLSGWNGSLVNNGTLNVNISGMESGGTMSAALVRVNSVSYTGTASSTYTVAALETHANGTTLTGTDGTLVVGSLSGSGALTISGSVELAGGEYEGSTITVDTDATLHLNGVQAHGAVLSGAGTVKLAADQVTVAGVTASSRIEAEGEGSQTLEIAGEGTHSSNATIGANVDLVMSGEGSQTFNGDLTAFNGAVDVLDGTLTFGSKVDISSLTMKGGEIGLANGSSLSSVRVASGAEASINAQGGTIALEHAIMNSGALTLAGTIDASALEMQTRDNGYIAVGAASPTKNGSGFATVQNAVEVVRNVVAGELHATNVVVTRGGLSTTLDSDGWARFETGDATNYDTYYLRDNDIANLSVTQIQNAAAGHATLNKIVFDNMEASVNLVVDTVTDLSLFKVNEDCTANLTLTADGRISLPNGYRGVDGFVKLSGEGTYSITNTNSLGKGVSLADGWQGTVALSGTANTLDLARRGGLWAQQEGQAASTVRLDGWTSALTDAGWETGARVHIGEGGLTVQGNALAEGTTASYVFNNAVSGTGDIINNRAGSSEFTFADVQGWSGSFVGQAGESFLAFTGSSVGASIEADGGEVTAQFSDAEQTSVSGSLSTGSTGRLDVIVLNETTFTGEANVSLLHVGELSTAHIASDFTARDINSSGFILVDNGGTLNVDNGISMLSATILNAGTVAFSSPDTVINLMDGGEYMESESTYQDINGGTSATGNGFKLGGGVTIIDNRGGSITGAQNVTVNYGGIAYQLQDSGVLLNPADVHTYYIHQGTVNYSTVKDAEGLVGLHLDSTLKPDASATLSLDTNLADTLTEGIVSSGGTINLGQDVTLAASSLNALASTTLNGQGTYDLGTGTTLGNVSLGSDWHGTVRIADHDLKPFNLSQYMRNNSTVAISGISGWWDLNHLDFTGKLVLEKDAANPDKAALYLTDASSGREYKLSGGVSGDGDYVIAYPSGKSIKNGTHTIGGDVENWTGSFIDAVAQTNTANTTTLQFVNNTLNAEEGTVNIGANILSQRSGAAHVFNVNVTGTNGSVHMKGEIKGIDKLTYDSVVDGRTLTLDNIETNDDHTIIQMGASHGGGVVINNLSGSGELVFENTAKNSNLVSFDLAGGDYDCEAIEFRAMTTALHTGARSVLLSISDSDVAANSVIHTTVDVQSSCGNNACIGIGINAETVSVGGLNDVGGATANASNLRYSIVSGKPTGSVTNGFSSDSVFRTLEITGEGGDSIAGIGSHLNITMNGSSQEASQSFSGDMSSFNGTIHVQAGKLDLSSFSIGYGSAQVDAGAELNMGSDAEAYIMSGGTISNAGTLTMSGQVYLDVAHSANFEKIEGSGTAGYDGKGIYEGSGYYTTTFQYYLVHGAQGSTLNASELSDTFIGGTRVLDGVADTDIVFTFNASEERAGTYFVNSNLDYNHDEMQGATSFVVKEGTTLSAASGTLLNGVEIVKDGSGSMNIGSDLALTTNASASEDRAKVSVIGGELRILAAGTTVDGQRLLNTNGGEQTNTAAFTKLFKGEAVSVTDGGKLVLEGNINVSDWNTNIGTALSGMDNLEITGDVKVNAWGAATYSLGSHSMKVGGDFWLTNKQDLSIAGGSLEVGHSLKLGHNDNGGSGNYRSHVTAEEGSNLKLGDIQFNGGANAVTISGSTVTFTKTEGNVLSHVNNAASTANTVTLAGDKLVARDNSWTIEALTGNKASTVTVSGTTTLDIASGESITIGGANVSGTINFGDSEGTLVLKDTGAWQGSVNITESGTLSIAGTSPAQGSAVVTVGGTLDLTGATAPVSLGSLTMNDGGTLKLGTENMLSVMDALTLNSGSTLDLSELSLTTEQSSYVLATGGSISVDENVTLTLATEYQDKASLYYGDGSLVLLLNTGHKNLVWQGPNGEWSVNPGTKDWYLENTTTPAAFADGDTVRFGADSNGYTATLGSNVSPAGFTVNETASATVNLGGYALTTDQVTVASGSALTVSGSTGSFTNTGALSLDNSKLSINNGGAEVSLGNVTMHHNSTLELLAAKSVTAQSVFAEDNVDNTIKLGADMTIDAGGSTEATAGALYTMGANHTLQIVGVGETVHTLTVDKFDIANVNTGVSLQNANLVVNGAATVGELSSRTTNHGTMTVGQGASLTFDGSVVWSNGGKYVDLDISGTVNVNGGATNKLHDVTLNAGSALNFKESTTSTIEGALALAGTVTNNGTLSIANISVAGGTSGTIAGSGETSITGAVSGNGSLVKDGTGTLNLGGSRHVLANLYVNGGTVTTTHSGGDGCVSGTININAGGTFEVNGEHDAFGYDDNVATAKIAMAGTEGNEARLVLNPSNHGSVTMKTNLELNGNAVIEAQNGASFNTYGCGISVSGTGNTISGMQVRSNVTVNTADGAELTVNSLAQSSISGSSGSLTKTGAGTLILDAVTIGNTATTVSAGTLALTQTVDAISGALTVNNGGTLKLAEYEDHAVTVGSLTLNSGAILDVSTLDFDTASTNPYTLMRGTTIATPVGVVVNFGSADPVKYVLAVNEGNLVLTFMQTGNNLVWNGGSANWSDRHWHEADTPSVHVNFRDNDSVTFAADAGTATLQGNVIADTMTLESGANLVLNTNGHNLTTLKLNATGGTSFTKNGDGSAAFGAGEAVELTSLSVTGGSVAFGGHVTVTGDNYIQPTAGANIAFNDGLSFTGTGGQYGYAIVFGNGSTVTFGETSDLSTKLIGSQQGSTLALAAGATVNAKGVYNTTKNVGNNGNVVLGENATLTVGTSGLYTPSLTIGSGSTVSLGGNSQMSAVTGAGALNVTGGTVQLNGSNTGFTGDVTISGGTLKVGDQKALGEHHEGASQTKKITVATGGTLDLNGKADANFTYTLAGGTLTNSGNAIGDSSSQTVGLQLTANSTVKVDSGHEFRLLARSYDPTKLDLKGNTLEKTGTGQFHLKNTTVTDGIIDIQGGEVKFDGGSTAADVVFDGGTVTGTLTLTGDITLTANRESATSSAITAGGHGVAFAGDADLTVSGVVSGNGTSVAKTGSGTVTLSGANTYSGSTTVDGGTLKSTGTNAQTMAAASIASGAALEAAGNRTVSGALSGAGIMTYSGESAGSITLNGSVTEFTGTLQNASNADLALSLSAAANQLHMDIASTGDGKVNLSMVHADYNLYGTQTVNNIAHDVNMTMEVRETGDVTATGKVLTGRLVVGEANTETGAVFTLSGAEAQLFNNKGEHKYTAAVQGYGTFAVVAGATQELTSISGFHGTFAADGSGSVLTLNATLGSGTALNATNGGVINLTQSYTMDGDTVVDGGTVSVSKGLTVDGAVDLSKGTLTQTGGTISVNAGKSLTLGEASITSAISNGGTVEFTKDITATGLQESIAEVNVGANDTKTVTANHFDGTRTESSIRVVSGDGTVTTGGHKVTQGDVAYTLQQDGTAVNVTESSVDYATFLQHEAGSSLNSSTITATAEQHDELIVNVDVNNANLNVDSALMVVQARAANITNTGDADNIEVLHIAGGTNNLTGGVSDLAQMTLFAQAEDSSLHIHSADGSAYQAKAGAVEFHGAQSEREVTISAARTDGDGADIYSLENERYSVEAHKMVKVAAGNVTVNNHIKTDTVSTGGTTGSLTLANGADAEALSEVIAASGDVTFLNMAAENETATGGQTSISLNKLEIGAGKTVSFYEAAAPVSIDQLAQEASVSVVGTLTAGQGATLNSDLVMESGSTLDVRGTGGAGLLMGSEVTLNKGMTLSDYSGEWASWEAGTTYTLFTGVDGLDIGNGVTTGTMDYTAWVDAKEYFSNIQESNRYFLCYGGAPAQDSVGVLSAVNDGSNVGMIYIMTVPEPTTGTLSLLALAALAARRRRR